MLPVSFVLDGEGRIRYSALGEIDWAQDGVRKAILALMPAQKQGQTTFSENENVVCPCFFTQPRAALSAPFP